MSGQLLWFLHCVSRLMISGYWWGGLAAPLAFPIDSNKKEEPYQDADQSIHGTVVAGGFETEKRGKEPITNTSQNE